MTRRKPNAKAKPAPELSAWRKRLAAWKRALLARLGEDPYEQKDDWSERLRDLADAERYVAIVAKAAARHALDADDVAHLLERVHTWTDCVEEALGGPAATDRIEKEARHG